MVTPSTTINGGIELDKNTRIETIKSIFNESEIKILTPTEIQIPLSFREGEAAFFTETDREAAEKLASEFIEKFVKPSDRIYMWEKDGILNFGAIIIEQNIPEMHYIAISIGK